MIRRTRTMLGGLTLILLVAVPASGAPCVVPDNGSGTVDLPPTGCEYLSLIEVHAVIDGQLPGATINIDPVHSRFFNINRTPGGKFGGEIETFDSILTLAMHGTGALAGFERDVVMQVACEVHTGPRVPGGDQSFPSELVMLDGELFGDPDFDVLRIRAGQVFGLPPSSGQTTLAPQPGSAFTVDSFFNVFYEIEFRGAPASTLEGFGGTTGSRVLMAVGEPATGACPPFEAGMDEYPSTARLVLDVFGDGGEPFVVRLSSADLPPSRVQRQQQVGDTIDTELEQLELVGYHPRLGQIIIHESSTQPSTGQMSNLAFDPTTCALTAADSFLDVIIDIDLPDIGETWTNSAPLRVRSRIDRLPPQDDRYESPFLNPVQLVEKSTGNSRGQVLYQLHHADPPFPPPGPDCFDTQLDFDLTLPLLGLPDVHPILQGPATVMRGAPQAIGNCSVSGSGCSSNAGCPPDETCELVSNSVQNELVAMELSGFEPVLGPMQLRIAPEPPSAG